MRAIEFFAHGIPKGQPRPRAFSRNGHARVFDPSTAEGWKAAVAIAGAEYKGRFATGPLKVAIRFAFPRPKAHRHRDGSVRASAPTFHTATPDADNAAKAVLDALTILGVWGDDAQVAQLWVSKRYADESGPGALITISEIEEVECAA